MGKHDLNPTQDKDGRTYPGTRQGAKLKAAGKITAEGKRTADPKHAKD
jgi:hypothetical protein